MIDVVLCSEMVEIHTDTSVQSIILLNFKFKFLF